MSMVIKNKDYLIYEFKENTFYKVRLILHTMQSNYPTLSNVVDTTSQDFSNMARNIQWEVLQHTTLLHLAPSNSQIEIGKSDGMCISNCNILQYHNFKLYMR